MIARTTFGFRLPFFGPFAIADMAGLDVYAFCYHSLQTTFPERTAELVAYRNKAYVRMQQLLDELGPSPLDE